MRGGLRGGLPGASRVDLRRDLLERREHERTWSEPVPGALLESNDDLHRKQRVSADLEEVVARAHSLRLEQLPPNFGDQQLRLAARRDELIPGLDLRVEGIGERLAINLAVVGEGQGR